MLRKRFIFFIALIIFFIFLFTTNYLLVALNALESEVKKDPTIEDKIYYELKKLPDHYKSKARIKFNEIDIFINNTHPNIKKNELINLKKIWRDANSRVSKIQLFNITDPNLGKVLYALKKAKIVKADVDPRGTQLKLLLTLEGDQQIVFKPKWYEKERTIEGPVYAGKDRYGSEIVAFYLAAILNKPLTPISVEREISFKYDILPVATKRLLDTSYERNNRTCLYGKCFYCKKEDPICEGEKLLVTGAVIFNIKAVLKNNKSPWQRTYQKGKKAAWEETKDYCKTVRSKLPRKRLYDLIDTSIFDFFLQNGDRHHYETFGDTIVLLDNGKGLGNPNVHHIDILAPLYQCCMLRRDTLKTLLGLTGGILRRKLEQMPNITNILTEAHLAAIEKRLLIIFATIEYCNNLKRNEHNLYQYSN